MPYFVLLDSEIQKIPNDMSPEIKRSANDKVSIITVLIDKNFSSFKSKLKFRFPKINFKHESLMCFTNKFKFE